MGDLTRNFSRYEFACKCGCGLDRISLELVERLQAIRDRLSKKYGEDDLRAKIPIASGVRCEKHNAAVGGVEGSEHVPTESTPGEAADVTVDGSKKRFEIVALGYEVGFLRIGLDGEFVHFGISKTKPQRRLWLY